MTKENLAINKILDDDGPYVKVILEKSAFYKLNPMFFISDSTRLEKFMCANEEETTHLRSFGVEIGEVSWDFYRILLQDDE